MNKKVVVITGASSGIGKEAARLFAEKGYFLILSGRNEKELEEFKDKNAEIVIGDITFEEIQNQIVNLIKNKYQRVDILVNNAGITYIQPFEKNTKDQVDRIVETNLKAPIFLTQKIYPIMVDQNFGHIIFTNSTAGKEPKLNHTLYSATKFGLSGFARTLRLEAKKHNIRVTSLHPGGVKTKLYDNVDPKPDISTYMDPKKVAEILIYLAETQDLSPDEVVINRMAK